MIELLQDFFSFRDANVLYVVIGSVILGATTAVVGTFKFLQKQALVGDAVAHSVLPGICLSFMLTESKDPLFLLLGATVTGWLAVLAIDRIANRTRIGSETAIAIVLSVFYGIGILLLTHIQQGGSGAQSGLDKFLFGSAASMTPRDIKVFGALGCVIVLVVIVAFKELKVLTFDPQHARAIGLPVRTLETLLSTITVLAVAIGMQAVGIVLIAALLITPASAARGWSDKLLPVFVIAAVIGGISGITGAFISYSAPHMPTGPWTVVTLSLIAILTLFLAPKRGVVSRLLKKRQNKIKIRDENILKTLYHCMEEEPGPHHDGWRIDAILSRRAFSMRSLKKGLKKLRRQELVKKGPGGWLLTDAGTEEGKRIVRLHRLWELYLNQRLKLAPDHVHQDAEAIEHIITPELERELEKELGYPETDPHERTIPERGKEKKKDRPWTRSGSS